MLTYRLASRFYWTPAPLSTEDSRSMLLLRRVPLSSPHVLVLGDSAARSNFMDMLASTVGRSAGSEIARVRLIDEDLLPVLLEVNGRLRLMEQDGVASWFDTTSDNGEDGEDGGRVPLIVLVEDHASTEMNAGGDDAIFTLTELLRISRAAGVFIVVSVDDPSRLTGEALDDLGLRIHVRGDREGTGDLDLNMDCNGDAYGTRIPLA